MDTNAINTAIRYFIGLDENLGVYSLNYNFFKNA
jgi:hypothetical protein